jgi:hypothetical protein
MSNAPLRVACAHCQSKFQVADQLVHGKVVRFRCKRCKGTIEVDGRSLVEHGTALLDDASDTTPTRTWIAPAMHTHDSLNAVHRSEAPESLSISDGLGDGLGIPSLRPPPPDLSAPDFSAPRSPFSFQDAREAEDESEHETGTLAPLFTAPPTSFSDHANLAFDPRLVEPSIALATAAPARRRPTTWVAAVALLLVAGSAAAVLSTRAGAPAPQANGSEAQPGTVSGTRGIQPSDLKGVTAEPPAPAHSGAQAEVAPVHEVAAPPTSPAPVATPAREATTLVPGAAPGTSLPKPAARPAAPAQPVSEQAAEVPAPQLPAPAEPAPAAITDREEPEGPAFNTAAARAALEEAALGAASCKDIDAPSGPARLAVTFAPTGRVTTAEVESGPFVGTPAGGCLASKFRSARVPAFGGEAVTVHKTVSF